jgi:uncharacterized membrane protein YkvA (DUF1232 family)
MALEKYEDYNEFEEFGNFEDTGKYDDFEEFGNLGDMGKYDDLEEFGNFEETVNYNDLIIGNNTDSLQSTKANGDTRADKKQLKNKTTTSKGFKENFLSLCISFMRRDTPIITKILIVVAIAYTILPIDFIPDFILGLGFLDDILQMPLLFFVADKLVPKNIKAESDTAATVLWEESKPKIIKIALIILTCFIGLIVLMIFLVTKLLGLI